MLFTHQNALITGASRGIGAATLQLFAAEGANAWAVCREMSEAFEQRCEALAREHGVWIKPLACDLTDATAVGAMFKRIMADKQPLDILVNNAGYMGEDRMFQMTPQDDMRHVFDINFFGMVEVSRLATRLMARNRRGAVVNVASVAGLDGDSRLDYSASKAAVVAATKKMARELISVGSRVNCVAPGMTDTDMTAGLGDTIEHEALSRVLLRRKARPEEIANVIAFLASEKASYVDAQVWRVDGGIV